MLDLPFVWELKYDGNVSHLIGVFHYPPDVFDESILKYMKDKSRLLSEARVDDGQDLTSLSLRLPFEPPITDFLTQEEIQEMRNSIGAEWFDRFLRYGYSLITAIYQVSCFDYKWIMLDKRILEYMP